MIKRILPAASVMVLLIASPAFAVDVKKSVEVSASPEAAWDAIGDFCGIGKWHPAIAKCDPSEKGHTNFRTLSLKGGGEILEKETARNNRKHSYSYAIVKSPLPVEDYKSTISVSKHGKGSTIDWTGHFKAKGATNEKAADVIGGIYTAGLDSLKSQLNK